MHFLKLQLRLWKGSIERDMGCQSVVRLTQNSRPPIHADAYTQFRITNEPNMDVFGLWEEVRAFGGNPRRHWKNIQTP